MADDFGKGSPEYAEFFPQGITPYRDMNETDVEKMLPVLIAAAHKHKPALEPELAGLLTQWKAARKAAGDQIAGASAVDLSQEQAVAALRLTLMKVIFTAALAFVGQESMGPVLFDQSRLENNSGGKKTAAPPATP